MANPARNPDAGVHRYIIPILFVGDLPIDLRLPDCPTGRRSIILFYRGVNAIGSVDGVSLLIRIQLGSLFRHTMFTLQAFLLTSH